MGVKGTWLVLAGWMAASAATVPPCLSVSPFRASNGADTLSVRQLRQRLVDSLGSQLGAGWKVETAGNCPESGPVLDLFQRPGDLIESGGNSVLRARLEWRQAPGMTIVNLEPQGRLQGGVDLWARMLVATIRTQMLVPVQIGADAPGVQVSGDLSGAAPVSGLLPPGPFRVTAKAEGRQSRRFDTILQPSVPLQIDLHLPLLPKPPEIRPSPSPLPRWIAYGTAVGCFGGASWFALRQVRAQDEYRALGAGASASQFASGWQRVRQANLARNSLAGAGVGALGIGIAFHFKEASFRW
jgi:hypothetical protein